MWDGNAVNLSNNLCVRACKLWTSVYVVIKVGASHEARVSLPVVERQTCGVSVKVNEPVSTSLNKLMPLFPLTESPRTKLVV